VHTIDIGTDLRFIFRIWAGLPLCAQRSLGKKL